jgi:subtilisin family serine protease
VTAARARGFLAVICALATMTMLTAPALGAWATRSPLRGAGQVAPTLRGAIERSDPQTPLDVIVTMRDRADLGSVDATGRRARLRELISLLRSTATRAQSGLLRILDHWRAAGRASRIRPLWVLDAVAVRADAGIVDEIAAAPGVRRVDLDKSLAEPADVPIGNPEPGIDLIGAPGLWSQGLTGAGVVVATMDTGVDVNHPDLASSWRGGTNSWFDPSGEHPSIPTDLSGHGTATMGVIVGRDGGGTTIGVAPDATWISAKIFNDAGVSTTSRIHASFQWLLDPDADLLTPDAPDVVEGSWALGNPGCDLTFEPDLMALRTAGILPVFSAGNGGPTAGTAVSPANNPSAFAVGATDGDDVIADFSGRGPSACGGTPSVYPDLVAPGVDVHTADLFGAYTEASGTSISAPHVAGGLALLLQAFPTATPAEQEMALTESGVDLGVPSPDDVYGFGLLDVPAAYAWLQAHLEPPPPALPALVSTRSDRQRAVAGLTGVRDEDVLSFDGTAFATVIDGSDLGLGPVDVDAVSWVDADTLLLSFDKPITLPAAGAVDDSDVVRFDATSLGSSTAGTFSIEFQGADVGLTTDAEDVDAIDVLASGDLVLSIRGRGQVVGVDPIADEDAVRFVPTSLGSYTEGTFSMLFDGSDVGLATTASEDIDAFVVRGDGSVALSTAGPFSVAGLTGDGEDVVSCMPSTLGSTTTCAFSDVPVIDGGAWGWKPGWGIDAFDG